MRVIKPSVGRLYVLHVYSIALLAKALRALVFVFLFYGAVRSDLTPAHPPPQHYDPTGADAIRR